MKTSLVRLTLVLLCAAAPAGAATLVLDPDRSRLGFAFIQAGAENRGQFRRFAVELEIDEEGAPEALEVTVQVDSLDTQDAERDDVLRSAELFDVAKHPTATFTSRNIKRTGRGRYEALGTLTLRGMARNVRVPFTLTEGRMNGGAMIRRLDFGVGRGEWQSTEWVGNAVKVTFALRLVPKQ